MARFLALLIGFCLLAGPLPAQTIPQLPAAATPLVSGTLFACWTTATKKCLLSSVVSVINVATYGTNQTACTNAMTAAVAQNRPLYFPAGTYLCSITIPDNVPMLIYGDGKQATIIEQPNGANADTVTTQNIGSLKGSNTAGGGIFSVTLRDLTIDGNKANNSAGICLDIYGHQYTFENVQIQNCPDIGFYSEYAFNPALNTVALGLEANIINLTVKFGAADAVVYRGPHDSSMVNTIINGNAAGRALQIEQSAGVYGGQGLVLQNFNEFNNLAGVYSNAPFSASGVFIVDDCNGTYPALDLENPGGSAQIVNGYFGGCAGVGVRVANGGENNLSGIFNAGASGSLISIGANSNYNRFSGTFNPFADGLSSVVAVDSGTFVQFSRFEGSGTSANGTVFLATGGGSIIQNNYESVVIAMPSSTLVTTQTPTP